MPSAFRSHRIEVVVGLLGAVVGVVAMLGVAANTRRPLRHHTRAFNTRWRAPTTASHKPNADSPAEAVTAATRYLIALGNPAIQDPTTTRLVIDSIAAGPLRTQLEASLPAVANPIRARLQEHGAPASFDGWPLGYRVVAFTGSAATVEVWHLDIAASSTLGLMSADFATTTCHLRSLAGRWRIERVSTSPGPAPPSPAAREPAVDAFARAASEFSTYRNVP